MARNLLADGLESHHRRALTFFVTAHAVAGDQQRRFLGDFGPEAVLIALTCAFEAEFSVFNAQAGSKSLG